MHHPAQSRLHPVRAEHPQLDEFLTVKEVAQLLKLNQQTVRNMIDRGELPAVRVGARRVRMRREDSEAFLDPGAAGRAADVDAADVEMLRDQLRARLDDARAAFGDDGRLAAACTRWPTPPRS
jgi:excisionase family DNA binding protein